MNITDFERRLIVLALEDLRDTRKKEYWFHEKIGSPVSVADACKEGVQVIDDLLAKLEA